MGHPPLSFLHLIPDAYIDGWLRKVFHFSSFSSAVAEFLSILSIPHFFRSCQKWFPSGKDRRMLEKMFTFVRVCDITKKIAYALSFATVESPENFLSFGTECLWN